MLVVEMKCLLNIKTFTIRENTNLEFSLANKFFFQKDQRSCSCIWKIIFTSNGSLLFSSHASYKSQFYTVNNDYILNFYTFYTDLMGLSYICLCWSSEWNWSCPDSQNQSYFNYCSTYKEWKERNVFFKNCSAPTIRVTIIKQLDWTYYINI